MPSKNQIYQWKLLKSYIFSILPQVDKELRRWRKMLKKTSPSPLRLQALNSLQSKRFHCQGGAFYALLNPAARHQIIPLIVAFQTISDYLDNLCDRITWEHLSSLREKEKDCYKEQGFRQLHLSMIASLEPNFCKQEFYKNYPLKKDGGYLEALVNCSQKKITALPNYGAVKEKVIFLTELYSTLQALKHLSLEYRQSYLEVWSKAYSQDYPYLLWNEFAAATGSTLGTFALLALASREHVSLKEVEDLFNCYFPWICGLHILLDYLIDQEEDNEEEDLNFTFYYSTPEQCYQRLAFFVENAMRRAGELPDPSFHSTVVKGMLALYLSDPKIKKQNLEDFAYGLLHTTGEKDVFQMFWICKLLRKMGRL